jgi:hypothetical protein
VTYQFVNLAYYFKAFHRLCNKGFEMLIKCRFELPSPERSFLKTSKARHAQSLGNTTPRKEIRGVFWDRASRHGGDRLKLSQELFMDLADLLDIMIYLRSDVEHWEYL